MQLSYRIRMILYNILLFAFAFLIVVFCVFQGTSYFFINQTKDVLLKATQDSTLFISQELKNLHSSESLDNQFIANSLYLSKNISENESHRVLLFDTEGNQIADSVEETSIYNILATELTLSMTENAPVFTLKSINDTSTAYFTSPVVIDNTVIGYIGFTYSMYEMDAFLHVASIFFAIGGLIGLLFLVIVTLSFSRHFFQPIKDLTKISKEINNGNYNLTIYYKHVDEIGDLTHAFNGMVTNINSVILQLESERKRLAGVLASIDDGLLAIDKNGNIITSNSYIKTYFNVSNPKTIYDFQHQSFLRDIFDSLKNGKDHISEEIDCNDRNLLLIGSPIREKGFEENYMIIIRNMTAARHIQEEQRKFISSVSHELRTPLTTIIGYTDMLTRRQVVDQEIITRSLNTINREGHRLLRLVDNLLNVNKFDRAEFDFKKTNLNIVLLLSEVVEQMQIKASQSDIEINYVSDELPEILGDYDRLQQVFINIIHNAIKYSNSGEIIDVISAIEDNHIVVSIRDYGPGISEIEQKRIFNAFYRVEEDRSRNSDEGGSGLGLYIVKQIVEKHDGKIDIVSQVGEGTNIIVTLPILSVLIYGGESDEKRNK
ncbi:HAMP domain-containing sensor histidine kinase [Acetobacterium woodii]|uniref:histidine kinase n=1 Tax=Acetobacterium woodii (strain ATCC 29683 / DSM 1030 / JCM 2381 / KCTC 1655 / WB1) TaxID=931626 RepID=H6LEG3_ACEWD|nr:ATP-binding protein [Acetobacterium woodii]AFA48066.1 phosphate regulon sensor protein PhoR1 [Acetobacterium woodii DSM 1030]